MGKPINLLRKLLRIITPEEISDIAVKYNEEGRVVALTEILRDRIFRNMNRDFSKLSYKDDLLEDEEKILKFKKIKEKEHHLEEKFSNESYEYASPVYRVEMRPNTQVKENEDFISLNNHLKDDESVKNMSAFILEEKERLKKSQQVLKQKEVRGLYEKNSQLGREEIKKENKSSKESAQKGNLIDRKQ